MKSFRFASVFLLFMSTALLWGCSAKTKGRMMVNSMKPLMDKMNLAANKNPDPKLVQAAMPASLLQLDGLIELAPDNTDLLLRAAEANSGYAFLFVQETNKPRAAKLFLKAREYALRVLNRNPTFKEAYETGSNDAFIDALNTLDKDDVPALFFATNCWLSWCGIQYQIDPDVLVDFDRVRFMMKRVLELDETFNFGAIHIMYGLYNAARPPHRGGNPEAAKSHFEKAFEISKSKYLLWHVLFARYYAVQIQDRDLFVLTLEKVVSSPIDLLPEKTFVNEVAKEKAKALLLQTDEFFTYAGLLKHGMVAP